MTADQSTHAKHEWWTLKQIYRHYLVNSQRADGRSAEEVIQACFEKRRFEDRVFHRFGSTSEDRRLYEDFVKPLDEMIEKAGFNVRRLVLEEAQKGNWIALGRRGPDAEHELIAPRYWPFLTVDIENNAVVGQGLSFRDLRCRLAKDVASDGPMREALTAAQQVERTQQPASMVELPLAADAPVINPGGADRGRNDGPGRPSYFHLVEQEFERRCDNGRLELSLNKEASALATWFQETYRDLQPYQPKTIANRLRKSFRQVKSIQSAAPKK